MVVGWWELKNPLLLLRHILLVTPQESFLLDFSLGMTALHVSRDRLIYV